VGDGEFKYALSVLERRRTDIQQRWVIPPSGVPKAIVDEFHRILNIFESLHVVAPTAKFKMLSLMMWLAAPLYRQMEQFAVYSNLGASRNASSPVKDTYSAWEEELRGLGLWAGLHTQFPEIDWKGYVALPLMIKAGKQLSAEQRELFITIAGYVLDAIRDLAFGALRQRGTDLSALILAENEKIEVACPGETFLPSHDESTVPLYVEVVFVDTAEEALIKFLDFHFDLGFPFTPQEWLYGLLHESLELKHMFALRNSYSHLRADDLRRLCFSDSGGLEVTHYLAVLEEETFHGRWTPSERYLDLRSVDRREIEGLLITRQDEIRRILDNTLPPELAQLFSRDTATVFDATGKLSRGSSSPVKKNNSDSVSISFNLSSSNAGNTLQDLFERWLSITDRICSNNELRRQVWPSYNPNHEMFLTWATYYVVSTSTEKYFVWKGPVLDTHGYQQEIDTLYAGAQRWSIERLLEFYLNEWNLKRVLLVVCNKYGTTIRVPAGIQEVVYAQSIVMHGKKFSPILAPLEDSCIEHRNIDPTIAQKTSLRSLNNEIDRWGTRQIPTGARIAVATSWKRYVAVDHGKRANDASLEVPLIREPLMPLYLYAQQIESKWKGIVPAYIGSVEKASSPVKQGGFIPNLGLYRATPVLPAGRLGFGLVFNSIYGIMRIR
jgi:hypothetical protein